MTVKELIAALQALDAAGHGRCDVQVLQYNGGDDVPANVCPVAPRREGEPVMLDTFFA